MGYNARNDEIRDNVTRIRDVKTEPDLIEISKRKAMHVW
jgi:hypothetical protein